MKKHSLLAAALATTLLTAMSVPAHAVVITANPSGNTDIGTVTNGETGTVTGYTPSSGYLTTSTTVNLPSDTEITLDYSFSGVSSLGSLADTYSFVSGGNTYTGSATSTYVSGVAGLEPGNSTVPTPLVFASANLPSLSSGTVQIVNDSSGTIQFTNLFSGLFTSGLITSIKFGVSAVPLPPALSLFGAGLLGLLGFGWMKRRQNTSFAV